jgi:hypothetical protein
MMMQNDFDLDEIRRYYSNMEDEEILRFAKNENFKLTGDAFLILREELNRRSIGADILATIEHNIILQASIDKQKAIENFDRNLYEDAIEFAFLEKARGQSNYNIYVGLIEMGIDEGHSTSLINKLDEWAEELLRDSVNGMQAGVLIVILGIIACIVTLKIERFEIGAILLLIAGLIRIAIYASKWSKYKAILNNIKLENKVK